MSKFLILVPLLVSVCCGCRQSPKPSPASLQEAWDERNDPAIMTEEGQVAEFSKLPLSGSIEVQPWSDTYWPSYKGGVSQRWYGAPSINQFEYTPLSPEEAATMSLAALAALSPAEKYDLYTGSKMGSLLDHERARVLPSAATWEGLCHGWAAAALIFPEPNPVLATGAHGFMVPFGSADLKALISLAQGNYGTTPFQFLGSRCHRDLQADREGAQSPECRDTNAGAFHRVLTNQIGLRKKGFVMDVTRGLEVWNQPVFGFRSRIEAYRPPTLRAAPGTTSEVVMTTEVDYAIESLPSWLPVAGTQGNSSRTAEYRYVLELDAGGFIIGGEWLQDDRPDFLWYQDATELTGMFAPLDTLLKASAHQLNFSNMRK